MSAQWLKRVDLNKLSMEQLLALSKFLDKIEDGCNLKKANGVSGKTTSGVEHQSGIEDVVITEQKIQVTKKGRDQNQRAGYDDKKKHENSRADNDRRDRTDSCKKEKEGQEEEDGQEEEEEEKEEEREEEKEEKGQEEDQGQEEEGQEKEEGQEEQGQEEEGQEEEGQDKNLTLLNELDSTLTWNHLIHNTSDCIQDTLMIETCTQRLGRQDQVVFVCLTCLSNPGSKTRFGFCFRCAFTCHPGHRVACGGIRRSFLCECWCCHRVRMKQNFRTAMALSVYKEQMLTPTERTSSLAEDSSGVGSPDFDPSRTGGLDPNGDKLWPLQTFRGRMGCCSVPLQPDLVLTALTDDDGGSSGHEGTNNENETCSFGSVAETAVVQCVFCENLFHLECVSPDLTPEQRLLPLGYLCSLCCRSSGTGPLKVFRTSAQELQTAVTRFHFGSTDFCFLRFEYPNRGPVPKDWSLPARFKRASQTPNAPGVHSTLLLPNWRDLVCRCQFCLDELHRLGLLWVLDRPSLAVNAGVWLSNHELFCQGLGRSQLLERSMGDICSDYEPVTVTEETEVA